MATLILGTRTRVITAALEQIQSCNNAKILVNRESFFVWSSDSEITPAIFENSAYLFFVFGTPLWNQGRFDSVENCLEVFSDLAGKAREVDGTFFVCRFDKRNGELATVTDRFGSHVIFFTKIDACYIFSTEFRSLYRIRNYAGKAKINEKALIEFLWFRRIFGYKTYVDDVSCLPWGSVAYFGQGRKIRESRYWEPKPGVRALQESKNGRKEYAIRLAQAIEDGVKQLTREGEVRGLMLSGGLDSRAILAVAKDGLKTFTNTIEKNNEFLIAQQAARLVGASHTHIPRPLDYVGAHFDNSVLASQGMTLHYECQFIGYQLQLAQAVTHLDIGLFYDIFFCGHYLPKHQPKVLNRNMLHFCLDKVPENDFLKNFANNVSYRQKTSNIFDVMLPHRRDSLLEDITGGIRGTMEEGRRIGFEGYQLWEYMHLSNVGRHYSMLMASSLRPFLQVNLPALTNQCYDLAFELPVEYKVNWNVYLKALKLLDPRLLKIRNANTNIAAGWSLHHQTLIKIGKGIADMLIPGKINISPSYADRSWPPVVDSIKKNDEIRNALESMFQRGRIFELELFDNVHIEEMYRSTLEGKEDHSILLNQLLTLEYGVLGLAT